MVGGAPVVLDKIEHVLALAGVAFMGCSIGEIMRRLRISSARR